MITSVDNPKIKLIQKLSMSKNRKLEQLFVVEGKHLVEEAKKSELLLEAFSIEEKDGYTQVSEQIMKKICKTATTISELGICKFFKSEALSSKILILDGIQDPGNMGTLMRSAVAFGFTTIFVGDGSVDIYNDKVIRASQGAIFKLNFLFGEVASFIQSLEGYSVFGTNVIRGTLLEEVLLPPKIAIVLGNEGNGISNEVEALKLDNIYIPIENTESLNVAIAGSIIMYELKD